MAHETLHLGLYVIFGVILLPVYVMIGGWLFGGTRDYRSVGLTFGYLIGFVVVIIGGLFVLGGVLSFVTPY